MVDTTRTLQLLSLLQRRRDWPGSDLAARLEVSKRTLRRDIERLREQGYTVDSDRGVDGGYRLGGSTGNAASLLDEDKATALAVALHCAASGTTELAESSLGSDEGAGDARARAACARRDRARRDVVRLSRRANRAAAVDPARSRVGVPRQGGTVVRLRRCRPAATVTTGERSASTGSATRRRHATRSSPEIRPPRTCTTTSASTLANTTRRFTS